jgi:2-succinyl-5-enolpyruvyl-6-hydroxy-3-cyclohexene-1-carboxylate synthase
MIVEPTAMRGAARAGGTVITYGTLLLDALSAELTPESVLVIGRPTLSRAVQRLIKDAPTVYVASDQPDWPDPQHTATHVTPIAGIPVVAPDPAYAEAWRRADAAAGAAVAGVLGDAGWPTGPAVARDLVAALPPDAGLFLGSSNPVRDVDLVAARRGDLRVAANRGVAGIDGTVSTALGHALATGVPTYALLGDLTFLHDLNGLLIGPDEPRPDLTIVVLNDNGGGIFSLLEQGAPEYAPAFERVFGTPHGADLAALCAGHHIKHTLAATRADLLAALNPAPGIRVVEVRTRRDTLRDLHARLRTAVRAAISPPGPR